jgi:hypothetical protein
MVLGPPISLGQYSVVYRYLMYQGKLRLLFTALLDGQPLHQLMHQNTLNTVLRLQVVNHIQIRH